MHLHTQTHTHTCRSLQWPLTNYSVQPDPSTFNSNSFIVLDKTSSHFHLQLNIRLIIFRFEGSLSPSLLPLLFLVFGVCVCMDVFVVQIYFFSFIVLHFVCSISCKQMRAASFNLNIQCVPLLFADSLLLLLLLFSSFFLLPFYTHICCM